MFEKEAQRSFDELDDRGIGDDWSIEEAYEYGFSNGVAFGYNKAKEEYEAKINALTLNRDELLAENERLEERVGELEECY